MTKRFYNTLIIILLTFHLVNAQVPVIQKIEPGISFPKKTIIITGSGFGTNPAQLQVWFDQVKGEIKAATEFSIEVEVPAQARLSNVTVINLTSRLSAQSKLKLMPNFSGEGFDAAKLDVPVRFTNTRAIFDLTSVDVDGDNKPDLIGTTDNLAGATGATTLMLLLNQSTVSNFNFTNTNVPALNVNAPTGYLAAGDLNGDGKPDLIASRSGTTANTVFVFTNTTNTIGNPNFSSPLFLSMDLGHFAREVAIHDLNGDGKPEIVVANSLSSDLYIFKNESSGGNLTINPTPIKVTVTGTTSTLAIQLQDMDGDGKTDIVATRNQGSDIFILKNSSTLSSFIFSTQFKITQDGQFNNDLATADLNGDGKIDIISTSVFNSQVQVILNKSSSAGFSFDAPITLTTDTQPFGIDVSDINGDGFTDLIIANRGVKTINVFLHNKNITTVGFTKVNIATDKSNWFVRAGDLDGDAKPDLAFTSFNTNPIGFSVDVLRNKNCHLPQILNTPPLTLCPSQTIKLLAIPSPGVTFDWNNGFSSVKNSPDPFADITVAATYKVTALSEAGACSVASAPITIVSGAGSLPADPTITGASPICSGTALTLSTPTVSGVTYSWTGPNNFTASTSAISIPSATIANAGNYILTLKSGDCTSNPVTKRVDVVTLGSFSVSSSSSDNSLCQGQTLILTVNSEPGYTFQWMKDGENIIGQTATTLSVNQKGAYKVKVTNTALSCSQETNAISVSVYAVPVAGFTQPATGCITNAITFTNTSTTDPLAASVVVYSWDFGDNSSSTTKDPTHSYATAQTFNPKLTVSYSGVSGCTNTATKSITIGAGTAPAINTTKTELCENDTETATLTVIGTYASFSWSTTETTASIDVKTPGDYSVSTIDLNGCTGSAIINLAPKTGCDLVTLTIPLVFTPNGDSQNDRWVIPGIENKGECTMNIFDGRGRKILEQKGYPIEGWDGTAEGKEVPEGTYFYVFSCPNENPSTGSVLIVR